MKIVFFGTPIFSVPFLRELIDDPAIEVLAVVCQPDKPAGRGERTATPPIKILAQQHNLPVLQPASLQNNQALVSLSAWDADFFVVVAYGKLIPKNILVLPKMGGVNVHPSRLPKYRGPSPIQWAIANGDAETGISIMLLDQGMDTGPILALERIELDSNETYQTLVEKIHARGPKLLCDVLKRYLAGQITPVAQITQGASITRLLTREDGRVDWTEKMAEIERKWRAYQPWPGTWSAWQRRNKELRLKFLKLQAANFHNDLPPGTAAARDNRLYVGCADGTLEISKIQPEGKGAMDIKEFQNGYPDIEGARLA